MTVADRRWHGWGLALLAVGMFGFGFALVPLYGLYCSITGTQQAGAVSRTAVLPAAAGEREVTIRFDTNVNADLPWEFLPMTDRMTVRIGEVNQVLFRVRNRSGAVVQGQAVPSVTPWQATSHFNKLACFCFEQQTLEGGEEKEMPLQFVVAPDLPESIDRLTLSYTFMRLTTP